MEFQVLLKTAFTTKKTLSFTINYRSQPWTVVHPQLQVKSVSMTKTILFWTLQVQNPTLVSLPTYTTVSKTTRPWIKAHPVGKKKFSRMPYTKILMIFSHFPAEVIIARTKIQNKNWEVHLTQFWQKRQILSFILHKSTNRMEKLLRKTISHSLVLIDQNSFQPFCRSSEIQLGMRSRLDLNSNKVLSYKAAHNRLPTFLTRCKICTTRLKINLDESTLFSI